MQLASDADFYLVFEAATADVSHVRDRRPHAQRSAALCLLAVCTRDERDFSGAELVCCTELEDRCLLSAFSNMQRLRRAARDRQLLIGLRAQFDLGVRAGAFHIIGKGHAGLEFVSRRSEHRHARCNYKRPANQRLALARSHRIIRDRHSHDLQRAIEIIRHVINDFALGAIGIDDARPKDDWLFRDPLEGIQALIVAAAAERRHRTQ